VVSNKKKEEERRFKECQGEMAFKRGRGGDRGTFYTYQRIIWMINVFKDGRAVGMI
jgi:hypothetical protein